MAIYYASNFGTMRKKVGDGVTRRWRGLKVVAAYNPSPKNPQTDSQQTNRGKFGMLSMFARCLANAIDTAMTYQLRNSKVFPRAWFMKTNKGIVTPSGSGFVLAYADAKISKGTLPGVIFGSPDFDTPQQVDVSFESNEELDGTSLDDRVYIAVYNPTAEAAVLSAPVKRSAGLANLMVPSVWGGQVVHLWGFVLSEATDVDVKVSDSMYIGTGTIS